MPPDAGLITRPTKTTAATAQPRNPAPAMPPTGMPLALTRQPVDARRPGLEARRLGRLPDHPTGRFRLPFRRAFVGCDPHTSQRAFRWLRRNLPISLRRRRQRLGQPARKQSFGNTRRHARRFLAVFSRPALGLCLPLLFLDAI